MTLRGVISRSLRGGCAVSALPPRIPLKPKERDIFYKLEEVGLVYTTQEEVTIKKGKVWRLHYWFLNRKKILQLSRGEEVPDEEDQYAIYADDDEIWERRTESE